MSKSIVYQQLQYFTRSKTLQKFNLILIKNYSICSILLRHFLSVPLERGFYECARLISIIDR
jgi:hypothetical protein